MRAGDEPNEIKRKCRNKIRFKRFNLDIFTTCIKHYNMQNLGLERKHSAIFSSPCITFHESRNISPTIMLISSTKQNNALNCITPLPFSITKLPPPSPCHQVINNDNCISPIHLFQLHSTPFNFQVSLCISSGHLVPK